MKKKNRTGILTALLAVLSVQGVESKKRIGIITAVLAVLLFASIPVQATFDPVGCSVNTLKIRSTTAEPVIGTVGQTIINFGVVVGTGGDAGGCNVGPDFSSDGTGDGVTVVFFKPDMNGDANAGPVLLDSGRSFSFDGSTDTCYYSSTDIRDGFCSNNGISGTFAIAVPSMQWQTNVNPGVTFAEANAQVTCPSGSCVHVAVNDLGANSNQLVGITIQELLPNTLLTKTANPTFGNDVPLTVTYTYTEKNTGNVNLTNVQVTDSNCAPTLVGTPFTKQQPLGVVDVLVPGATATFTCTKTYTTAGTFTNTAFGHGNPTYYDPVTNTDVIVPTDITYPQFPSERATVSVPIVTPPPNRSEFWLVEWFHTKPDQYTEFLLPNDQNQKYLITSGFRANESTTTVWDGIAGDANPIAVNNGSRLKYWHDPNNMKDLYVNKFTTGVGDTTGTFTTLRLYGTFNEGPGDQNTKDPVTGLKQENPGYTDPISEFYPQGPQSPVKDFVTFNPAIMEHNSVKVNGQDSPAYPELLFRVNGLSVQLAKEKVFKRMWYEKEWFKNDNMDGIWHVVVEQDCGFPNGQCDFVKIIDLDDWNAIPDWQKLGLRLREHNNPADEQGNPEENADTYGPAIKQEFTYMTLDSLTMPILVDNGSRILIPTANNPNDPINGFGLNDFTYTGNSRDYVKVESEQTLGMDIDNDGVMKPMDIDGKEVSGDESVVMVLPQKFLEESDSLQFFDNVIRIKTVFTDPVSIVYDVCDNEGDVNGRNPTCTNNEVLNQGGVAKYQRGDADSRGPFYIKLIGVDTQFGSKAAVIEVGRLFGNTLANIGANQFWNQKAFIVQGVFYNVVAIKADNNMFKYITFREKLPKEPIKIYGTHLQVWGPETPLPEMPPFNQPDHIIMEDVQPTHTTPIKKIGGKKLTDPLTIVWVNEAMEPRFRGELKEIYAESYNPLKEFWEVEWFHTQPEQFTEFVLFNQDQKYLVTTGFFAPEAETTIWDNNADLTPKLVKNGDRLKFWFDPKDSRGLFVNNTNGAVRIYGTFDEGPGDLNALDPGTGLKQENPGYTDPISPFYPQAPQAPRKDFVTFNPAIMEHNSVLGHAYPELLFFVNNANNQRIQIQVAKEKVFKRMWYEKEWFKNDNMDGIWHVVIEQDCGLPNGQCAFVKIMNLDEWNAMPEWQKLGLRLREHNNPADEQGKPEENADTYGPAIKQEFTYMTLDSLTMPTLVLNGSRILIPMANNGGYGLNSFDSTGTGVRDYVKVESEQTLGLDIDNDGVKKPMDMDTIQVNGNESVVMVLPQKFLIEGGSLQFFDNVIKLKTVFNGGPSIIYDVCDNEGTVNGRNPTCTTNEMLNQGGVAKYQRGSADPSGPFYIKLIGVDTQTGSKAAVIEVGRLFGNTLANIGANSYWNQKAFIVQGVFYNVVAIKGEKDNMFKYITFREKLPKEAIKIYGTHLQVWGPNTPLPEMPPFNDEHIILDDVLQSGTWPYPWTLPVKKIGDKRLVNELVIKYTIEAKEPRFKGELKEIYAQNDTDALLLGPTPPSTLNKVVISPVNPSIAAGNNLQFTATTNIQATLTWSSSNPAAGTIDSTTGLFNSVAAGTTTITVTAVSGAVSLTTSTTVTVTSTTLDGAALYASNCASCHQPLATSTKLGRTTLQIQGAIDGNVGGMGSLSALTPTQVQAIADALDTTPSGSEETCTLPNGKTVDLNGDGIVDINDASKLILKWGTNDSAADLNGDGIVDINDASKLILNWGKACT